MGNACFRVWACIREIDHIFVGALDVTTFFVLGALDHVTFFELGGLDLTIASEGGRL